MLTGRGRMPIDPEPLLSVDAIEGCRTRLTGPDRALDHGVDGTPNVTVCPLELLCELGGPVEIIVGREGLLSPRPSSLGTGESWGEPKGAIVLESLISRCEPDTSGLCGSEL